MMNFDMIILVKIGLLVLVTCVLVNGDVPKSKQDREEISSKIMFPNDFLLEDYRVHRHTGNSRITNMSPYRRKQEEESHFHPEDVVDYEEITNEYNASQNEIPLDFIRNINQYNVSDLLLNFVEGDMEYDEPIIRSRFGEDYEARSAAVAPKPAGCSPELKTIPLATSDDPSILFIPQCTKVERCGGCCSHNLLSCQPKEIETLSYRVMKTQYKPDAKKLKFLGKEIVTIERHIKCKCDCKVKEEVLTAHCNKYQEYRPSECRCTCTNNDEEMKCYKDSSKKLWNSELCACQCRELLQCSTGYYFDQIECKCVPNPKRRFASYERRGYVTETLTISPLPSDN